MQSEEYGVSPIAYIYNDFKEKFGLPRQSGMSEHLLSRIVMEQGYREREAFRGIEGYDRLWLLWLFDDNKSAWTPTVRPPRLGGNVRMGVFATRSPNRPNCVGLTCVKLISFEWDKGDGPVLIVSGADIKSGTPIIDIKPYIACADSYPDAASGFADSHGNEPLKVEFESEIPADMSEEQRLALEEILALDPRPAYHDNPKRIYGMDYGDFNVKFTVSDGRVTVREISRLTT